MRNYGVTAIMKFLLKQMQDYFLQQIWTALNFLPSKVITIKISDNNHIR